jgi:hypothetical protein
MGCPCRNKVKEAVTSANLPQGDPLASQRAYDANHTQEVQQAQEPVTASASR